MQPYSAIAQGYEELFGKDAEAPWQDYVVSCVKKYSNNNKGVDGGCGTGFITGSLYKNGFDVTGTDCSLEMLNIAYNNLPDIPFIMQKIEDTVGFKNLGFFTAINETFNYLPLNKVEKAFKNINKCLTEGGFFMFDIASPYKLRTILGDNEFTSDGDIAYIWRNTLKKDRVIIDFTCFYPDGKGKYVRKDESQTEYIHNPEEIRQLLIKTGFKIIQTQGHLGKKLTDKSERINYLVKKA